MTDQKAEATIQIFKKGARYYATLSAETPEGPLNRSTAWVGKATSPASAIDEVLALIRGNAHHPGRGRKPRGYWACRYLVRGG